MSWESPERLWLLAGVVALVVGYLVMQRRRSRYAVRFTNLRLLDKVAPARPAWRRHVPAGLFIAMLALLVVGFARPTDEVRVPRERATVMVAVDVSRSMLADDVPPDRLVAAKDAAREFVADLPEEFNVGLVAFAGSASVMVPPTGDREVMAAGIDRLDEGVTGVQGTAIGDAIDASLESIRTLDAQAVDEPPPARVVILSDGANTTGRNPTSAAGDAVEAGVPVDTISFGTLDGQIGAGQRVPVDGETLRVVSEQSGGGYYEAGSSAELREAYADIGSSVGYRMERQDVSARFIGGGLVFALLAAAASMLWFSRLP
ncbi:MULTISPECIES: VWA domain-containing protein [unclassified Micromonospora]|uniref:VWA domain-containing protein n=1 Tax=unclassified Micromonospora TaxID=2617518 RepID=UPI001034CCEA|nr:MULTISPECIES: VWA domain-containing protein [unclassified Micromonospora]QKW14129.1 VWA domain-containing protein [Verrucosispora sp. NA02020]TBL26440.1 VWA domain-containing protein [Verrucosispora sp. SN26_14.1]